MISRIAYAYIGILIASLAFGLVSVNAHDESADLQNKVIFSLPTDIAQMLRERNREGRGGCPGESSIFVHGFHYLDGRLDRTMWFLGAPDYLCETNSFVPVIVDRNGTWTAGENSEEDWQGFKMLAGVPVLFEQVDDLGFFLTSEWQVEAPRNILYYSADGVTWTSLELPDPTRKSNEDYCCYAASISSLCIEDSGNAYISYEESSDFEASVWGAPVDDAFPHNINWSRVKKLPEDAHCDRLWPQDFIPHSLREKTKDGALFDVSYDWAVLIPGPTK